MKFAEHLSAHITPEWRKQYITYEGMKDKLYEAVEEAPSPEMTSDEILQHHFARFDESFFQYCDKELLKINTFFSEKIAEATRKFAALQSDLSNSVTTEVLTGLRKRKRVAFLKPDVEEKVVRKSMHDIKLAFSEFYLSLILLQNYQTLNFTGFRKILKKHDKLLSTDRGAVWRQAHVETAPFYISKEVDHLIKETENVFTQNLESGDRQKAMKRLRVPPLGEEQNPWTTFRVGFFSGIYIVLIFAIIAAAILTADHHKNDWQSALRIFRGTFLVFLFIFLLGLNTYGWRSSGVNHILIFELDPRNHLTHQQFLELAVFFSTLWCLSVLAYLSSTVIHIPAFSSPICLVGFCLLYLINPIRILHYKSRLWLLKVLFRIVTAPFHYVGFADFWLADQLNSLTTVLLDFEYLVCFYAIEVNWYGDNKHSVCGGVTYGIRPIVAALPSWFRIAQCFRRYRDTKHAFPHIVNAGKYAITFLVVLFSTLNSVYKGHHGNEVIQNNVFFYLWIIAAFASTCYTFIWDIKMDWGLFDKNAKENRFLREEIVYAHKAYYYFAMLQDLVFRFTWTITVTIGEEEVINSEVLKTAVASLEVLRRFIWNFFRLENEHLNNCGQFRAVRDISIAPMNANDQALLEQMMDEEDGVTNRKINHKKFTKNNKNSIETMLLITEDD